MEDRLHGRSRRKKNDDSKTISPSAEAKVTERWRERERERKTRKRKEKVETASLLSITDVDDGRDTSKLKTQRKLETDGVTNSKGNKFGRK